MSSYDSNFDGWSDIQDVDTDGDGWVDTQYHDTDYNGIFDTAYTDLNRDGWSDTVFTDLNEDGWSDNRDGWSDTVFTDANEDGYADTATPAPPLVPALPDVPIDSVVSDVLAGAGTTDDLVDTVLAGLPPTGGETITSEIGGTLDFINGNGSILSGMIDDIESGNEFSESELDWASGRINSGGYTDMWDAITDSNNTSNDLRQDQLDDMYDRQQRRDEYDEWQEQRDRQARIDEAERVYQRTQDELGG